MNAPTPWLRAIFSPTGGTRAVADAITGKMLTTDVDLTLREVSNMQVNAAMPLLAVVPVYAGRVPAVALERLQKLHGTGGAAVAVVVYGNRAYDDALAELVQALQQGGYRVIAAAAFIAEHSVIRSIAHARPNEDDKQCMAQFAAEVQAKLQLPAHEQEDIAVPGCAAPGERKKLPVVPQVSEACGNCCRCARVCPVGAIPMNDGTQTDAATCILCMRCVAVCPKHARSLPQPVVDNMTRRLMAVASAPKLPEIFL